MDFLPETPAVSGMGIGDRIKDARKKTGISQAELAKLVGRSQSAVAEWETGETGPRRNIVNKIAAALNVSPLWLEAGGAADKERPYEADGAGHSLLPAPRERALQEAHGPVYASAPAGKGSHTISLSEIVEYRPKPSRWTSVKGLYGFYLISDCMEPRIQVGELIWVHPHRRPLPGHEAVFVGRNADAGGTPMTVAVYVGQTPARWIVRQHNPQKEFDLKKSDWDCQLIVDFDLNR